VKRMQPGFASSAGVTSAYLAARGITGSRLFLTGPYGFYNLYEQGDYHPERISKGIGQHFTINDLSLKPYPSCRMTHSTIGAALKLKEQLPTSDQIENIDISVSSMVAEMVGKAFEIGSNPQVDAQFSLGYTTACAFIRGDVFLDDFETEKIMDPAVQRLAGRVVVSVNEEIPAKDIFQTEIKVTLKDGSVLSHSVQVPPGNPEDPMSDGQCREKFNKCIDYSGLSFDDQARKELIYMIDNLEDLKDIHQLVRALAG
jgi:2-methylcitrate dehydratase PrpD